MRIQRDIPTTATTAGVERTNLRQYVADLASQRGVHCRCIRCREVGAGKVSEPTLITRTYEASGGQEEFISAEADDKLLGFVRLRFPPRSLHEAITPTSALIRELHVYGQALALGENAGKHAQHRGIGKALMAEAEKHSLAAGKDKLIVISGVGVRGYYRKLGYQQEGPYMTKMLK